MDRFLRWYLLITGTPAILVLLFPKLAVIGFLFFIIPGLAMLAAPDAFFMGLIFASVWFPLRRVTAEVWAALTALLVLAIVLFGAPLLSMWLTRNDRPRAISSVFAKAPIQIRGDVRIDAINPNLDKDRTRRANTLHRSAVTEKAESYACENLCAALLFEPGVRSVTVNASGDLRFEQLKGGVGPLLPAAKTYRLLRRGQCQNGGYDLRYIGYPGRTLADIRALAAERKQLLTTKLCVNAEQPLRRYDFLLRFGWWREDGNRSPWSLLPIVDGGIYAEARDGHGNVLLRRFSERLEYLSGPLRITPGDLMTEHVRFRWARENYWRGEPYFPGVYKRFSEGLAMRRTANPATLPVL